MFQLKNASHQNGSALVIDKTAKLVWEELNNLVGLMFNRRPGYDHMTTARQVLLKAQLIVSCLAGPTQYSRISRKLLFLSCLAGILFPLSQNSIEGRDFGFWPGLVNVIAGTVGRWHSAVNELALASHGQTQGRPIITIQPASSTAHIGASVNFGVYATEWSSLSFQWYKNGNPIPGANQESLILENIQPSDAATYLVVVSNSSGTATSVSATLTVIAPLIITSEPIDQVVKAGADARFLVEAASRGTLSYLWFRDKILIANATSNLLALTNVQEADAGSYSAYIYTQEGGVRSRSAMLTISGQMPPQITSHPTNQTRLMGGDASFSVQVRGGLPFAYQWFKNGLALSGANTENLRIVAVSLSDAGTYQVVVTNRAGIASSLGATLVVNESPVISVNPTNAVVLAGTPVRFSVEASGNPAPVFRWFKDGVHLPGAIGSALNIANSQAADDGSYYAVVTNSVGAATSLVAMLTVRVPATIKTHPVSQMIFVGQTAHLTADVLGERPLALQWFKGTNTMLSATNASLTITNVQLSDAGNYRIGASNALGSVLSLDAVLGVSVPVQITAQPRDQSVRRGSNATFSVGATGFGDLRYQWLKDEKLIAGATMSELKLFRVQPSDAGEYLAWAFTQNGSATSAVARLSVNVPPAIRVEPRSEFVLAGAPMHLSPEVDGTSPLFYQWFKNNLVIANATNLVLEFGNSQFSDQGEYRLIVTNSFGGATSSVARITINAPPNIRSQPLGQAVIAGSDIRIAVVADGTTPLEYQWFRNGNALIGATNWILELRTFTSAEDGDYHVVVSNSFGTATSTSAKVKVGVPASVVFQPVSQVANVGAMVTFGLVVEGTLPLAYQWLKEGVPILRGTNSALTISALRLSDAGDYTVMVSNLFGHATSAAATLLVRVPLAINGDLNRDGWPDIVFQNQNGQLASWFMENTEMISADFLTPSGVTEGSWTTVGSGDFDQDGSSDLVFQNSDGAVAVWFMNGRSLREATLVDVDLLRSEGWKVVGTGDFNRDEKTDLVVRTSNGRLGVSTVDRLTVTSTVLLNLGNQIDSEWRVAGTGDFNEDGKADLVFQHQDGTLAVWYLDGTTTSSVAAFNPSHPGDARWRVVGITDRSGDGHPDLLFQHQDDGTLALWLMDGIQLNGARLLKPSQPGGTWRVVAP